MTLPEGHGYVRPLANGRLAQCGGPVACDQCQTEEGLLARAVTELFYWQYSDWSPWFHHHLYSLISKADMWNRSKIAAGFPWEVMAFVAWESHPNEKEFFARFGLKRSALTPREEKREQNQEAK